MVITYLRYLIDQLTIIKTTDLRIWIKGTLIKKGAWKLFTTQSQKHYNFPFPNVLSSPAVINPKTPNYFPRPSKLIRAIYAGANRDLWGYLSPVDRAPDNSLWLQTP